MRIAYWNAAYSRARMIRDEIERLSGVHMYLTNNFRTADISYGNSSIESRHNSPEFINLCVNKYRFSQHLLEKGQYTPEFHRVGNSDGNDITFPAVIRETLTGFSGAGIHTAKDRNSFLTLNARPNWWWTPFIRCQFELRVIVMGGEFMKVFKKVPVVPEPEFPIRNSYNEYHYSNRKDFKTWESLMALQERLKPVLTGSFYALDLGWDSAKKEYLIFEANSAPGLNNNTATLFANYFIKVFGFPVKEANNEVLRAGEDQEGN